jgi:hypothetical protein
MATRGKCFAKGKRECCRSAEQFYPGVKWLPDFAPCPLNWHIWQRHSRGIDEVMEAARLTKGIVTVLRRHLAHVTWQAPLEDTGVELSNNRLNRGEGAVKILREGKLCSAT